MQQQGVLRPSVASARAADAVSSTMIALRRPMLACCLASAAAYNGPMRSSHIRRGMVTAAVAPAQTSAFELLNGVEVLRVTDGAAVELNQQWNEDERCALFFFRSFG